MVCEVGEEKVRSWEELGDEQQYKALLSDYFWGVSAVVVNEFVHEYLLVTPCAAVTTAHEASRGSSCCDKTEVKVTTLTSEVVAAWLHVWDVICFAFTTVGYQDSHHNINVYFTLLILPFRKVCQSMRVPANYIFSPANCCIKH